MKDPKKWDKEDLYLHLQHAIDLEFWTIPLYLTSLYSIKGLKQLSPENYPPAAKLLQSVVVQEMLHLEIVCNLSNALGYSPKFGVPHYGNKRSIPFVHPLKHELPSFLQDYEVNLGALDEERLKLFCVIEFPEDETTIEWSEQEYYQSIGELYLAFQESLPHLWDAHYIGDDRNVKQKETFRSYHNSNGRSHGFSQAITSLDTALGAIDAIVEQGEGANAKYVPADFRPHDDLHLSLAEEKMSHYEKFKTLLQHHKSLPEVYTIENTTVIAQSELDMLFSQLLQDLEQSFNSEGPDMCAGFWDNMFALKDKITAVWEAGTCPRFEIDIHT